MKGRLFQKPILNFNELVSSHSMFISIIIVGHHCKCSGFIALSWGETKETQGATLNQGAWAEALIIEAIKYIKNSKNKNRVYHNFIKKHFEKHM